MTLEEARRLYVSTPNPVRAEARMRSRLRREARSEARAQGVAMKRLRRKKLMAAVDSAFETIRTALTGRA